MHERKVCAYHRMRVTSDDVVIVHSKYSTRIGEG